MLAAVGEIVSSGDEAVDNVLPCWPDSAAGGPAMVGQLCSLLLRTTRYSPGHVVLSSVVSLSQTWF